MKKNLNIETLRGIAILFVLFAHSWFIPEMKWFASFFNFASGVDLFFVLSGFLMGVTYISKVDLERFNLKEAYNFYVKRISRLLPAILFWNIAIISLSYYWIALKIYPNQWEIIQNASSNLLFLGNFYNSLKPNPFGYWWSIGLEVQFYFLLPVLLLVLGRYFWKGIVIIVLFLTLEPIYSFDHFWMFRINSLFIGLIAYKIYSNISFIEVSKKINNLSIVKVQFIVVLLFFLIITASFRLKAFYTVMPFIIGIVYLAILLLVINLKYQLFGKYIGGFFIFLGKISFSLYLSHLVIFHLGTYYIPKFTNNTNYYFLVYPIATLVAYFSWRYIEPLMKKEKYLIK